MSKTPHYGQIITTKRAIIENIRDINKSVTYNTIYLIGDYVHNQDYYLRLYDTCSRLYTISKFTYPGKNGIQKLTPEWYQQRLFFDYAETIDEVMHIMQTYRQNNPSTDVITAESLFQQLNTIEKIWCWSISRLSEQVYIPELAYEFEYAVKNAKSLPSPEFNNEYSLFPSNYPLSDYMEGVAKYFEDIMISIF